MADSFFKNEPNEAPSGKIPNLDDNAVESADSLGGAQEGFQTEEGRLAAILSYIPFLCFIPLLNMKDNKEARFHARQGVILFLIELVAILFLVDGISDFVFKGILILAVALSFVGIYFALRGKSYKLPIISDLADKTKL